MRNENTKGLDSEESLPETLEYIAHLGVDSKKIYFLG